MTVRIVLEQLDAGRYLLSTEGTGAGDYERREIHPASLLSALSSLDLAVKGTALHCWLTGDPLGAIHQDPPRVPPVDTVRHPEALPEYRPPCCVGRVQHEITCPRHPANRSERTP